MLFLFFSLLHGFIRQAFFVLFEKEKRSNQAADSDGREADANRSGNLFNLLSQLVSDEGIAASPEQST